MFLKGLAILRPVNGIIACAGVFSGYTIATGNLTINLPLVLGMISAFTITSAGNAVNDFFDADLDHRIGKGKIASFKEKKTVLSMSALFFFTGLFTAAAINFQAFAIAIAVSLLLALYSGAMQKYKFVGNWVVGLGTALTLIFGAAIAQNFNGIFIVTIAAFLANVAREITKDLEDMHGDMGEKRTLPMIVSFRSIKKITFLLYMGAISAGIIAFGFGVLQGFLFILLFSVSAGMFINSHMFLTRKEFRKSQNLSKIGMITALIAFVAGVI